MTGPGNGDGPGANAATAIATRGLTKRFGAQAAVNSLELSVPAGSVFGFLGPNGSGKTTTIRMLLGLVAPSSGSATVLGHDMPGMGAAVLPHVGALVEGPAFYPFLTGRGNLNRLDCADPHAPAATRRTRVQHALARVGLEAVAGKKVSAYSLGMKQRLGLANALLRPRDLLILDEPTNGLDPQGTREVRKLIVSLTAEGTTVFVSSHLLAEVEQMCTHAAIVKAGAVVAQGTLPELRAAGRPRITVLTPDAGAALAVLGRLGLVPEIHQGEELAGAGAAASNSSGPAAAPSRRAAVVAAWLPPGGSPLSVAPEQMVAALVSAGVRVQGFAVDPGSLEDRFVELTGEGFDVAR